MKHLTIFLGYWRLSKAKNTCLYQQLGQEQTSIIEYVLHESCLSKTLHEEYFGYFGLYSLILNNQLNIPQIIPKLFPKIIINNDKRQKG